MMLTELTQIAASDLPMVAFKEHLRLGSGFSTDGFQDNLLESVLRAAIATIEGRTGKVLLEREFQWTVTSWRDAQRQPLPLAPVSAVSAFMIATLGGLEAPAPDNWVLSKDMQRPALSAKSGCLPTIPNGGEARVTMTAGFGPVWSDLPADLAHATLLLGAHYYEFRHEATTPAASLPFGVATLIERYRTVRIFGGGRA